MVEYSGRRSVSVGAGEKRRAQYAVAEFCCGHCYELRPPQYGNRAVESQPPETDQQHVARIGELPWNENDAHVDPPANESHCFYGIRTLHSKRGAIFNVLGNVQ